MAQIIIPTPLRKFTDQQKTFESKGATVAAAIQDLTAVYPDLRKHLFDGEGQLRNFVRIFVGEEDIQALNSENTEVEGKDVISIVPAIAGGVYEGETQREIR